MTWANKTYVARSLLRPLGLSLINLMFLFQLIVPAATAATSMTGGDEHHLEMTESASKCPMQLEEPDVDGHDEAAVDATHQSAAHCMPSICCFHDTVSSIQLITIVALLPATKVIDRGTAASSNVGSTQKRPPRQI